MRLGLFSVSYAGYWGQESLDVVDFIARAADLGYDAVMLAGKRPHLSPLDMPDERIAAIRRQLAARSIVCGAVAGYTDLSPASAAEVPYLELQIAYVESLSRIAAALDCPIVRVFTAYEAGGHPPHQIWQMVVTTLREMCDRAAPHGVTLAVQNHHDLATHTDALLELLTDVDRSNCGLGFDAWSPALRGEDLYEAAKKVAGKVVMTTNADYVRWPRFQYRPEVVNYAKVEPDLVRAVPFGEGFIDYEAFFRGLTEGGFDGIANYEMCSPIRGGGSRKNLDAYAAQYVRRMRART